MGMNSFSNRLALKQRAELEEELSGILDLHRNGDEFTASAFRRLKNIKFEPVDLSKLKNNWTENEDDRRIAPRFELKLTVLVCNHRKAFRTETKNVSVSGLLLKDVLPLEFSSNSFEVVVIEEVAGRSKNYLLFRGKAVAGPFRTPRVIFESLAADTEAKLLALLTNLTPLTVAK